MTGRKSLIAALEAAACEQVLHDEYLVAVPAQDVLALIRAYRESQVALRAARLEAKLNA